MSRKRADLYEKLTWSRQRPSTAPELDEGGQSWQASDYLASLGTSSPPLYSHNSTLSRRSPSPVHNKGRAWCTLDGTTANIIQLRARGNSNCASPEPHSKPFRASSLQPVSHHPRAQTTPSPCRPISPTSLPPYRNNSPTFPQSSSPLPATSRCQTPDVVVENAVRQAEKQATVLKEELQQLAATSNQIRALTSFESTRERSPSRPRTCWAVGDPIARQQEAWEAAQAQVSRMEGSTSPAAGAVPSYLRAPRNPSIFLPRRPATSPAASTQTLRTLSGEAAGSKLQGILPLPEMASAAALKDQRLQMLQAQTSNIRQDVSRAVQSAHKEAESLAIQTKHYQYQLDNLQAQPGCNSSRAGLLGQESEDAQHAASRSSSGCGAMKKQASFAPELASRSNGCCSSEDEQELGQVKHDEQQEDDSDIDATKPYTRLARRKANPVSHSRRFSFKSRQTVDADQAGASLAWSNRGISSHKLPAIQDALLQTKLLTRVLLAGNKLTNDDVAHLMSMLSQPEAPAVRELDLSTNTGLTWRCALPIAMGLGLLPSDATVEVPLPVGRLPNLQVLHLSGVRLGDRGILYLAEGLAANSTLQILDVSRCGINDAGGCALLDLLGTNVTLTGLNLSWNALRQASAISCERCLGANVALQELDISHNGFNDIDGARIVRGLIRHGSWRMVDLSYNTLGPGAAMVISELCRKLGEAASKMLAEGSYLEVMLGERVGFEGMEPPSARPVAAAEGLGPQLSQGPLGLDVSGNPVGPSGLRLIIEGLDVMSQTMTAAAGSTESDAPLPWPLQLSISHCNVANKDRGSSDNKTAGPNPFLPSLASIAVPPPPPIEPGKAKASSKKKDKSPEEKKKKAGKKGSKKGDKAGSKDDSVPVAPSVLTAESQSLDLQSPAGKYRLDLSHPASACIVSRLRATKSDMDAAVAAGRVSGAAVSFSDIVLNGKPVKLEKLANIGNMQQGQLEFTLRAPAVLNTQVPCAVSAAVVDWLQHMLQQSANGELWRLAVVEAAASCCYFTWRQCLQLIEVFDPQTNASALESAAQMLYARCEQPQEFWTQAFPQLPIQIQEALSVSIGDLAAVDMTRPAGRYTLNLSRVLDRQMALRLQLSSVLEHSWKENKYLVNWQNASLNMLPLAREGLVKLREYTIPNVGTLRLDYVTYQVPAPSSSAATDQELATLLRNMRAANLGYLRTLLSLHAKHAAQRNRPLPKHALSASFHHTSSMSTATAAPPARPSINGGMPHRVSWSGRRVSSSGSGMPSGAPKPPVAPQAYRPRTSNSGQAAGPRSSVPTGGKTASVAAVAAAAAATAASNIKSVAASLMAFSQSAREAAVIALKFPLSTSGFQSMLSAFAAVAQQRSGSVSQTAVDVSRPGSEMGLHRIDSVDPGSEHIKAAQESYVSRPASNMSMYSPPSNSRPASPARAARPGSREGFATSPTRIKTRASSDGSASAPVLPFWWMDAGFNPAPLFKRHNLNKDGLPMADTPLVEEKSRVAKSAGKSKASKEDAAAANLEEATMQAERQLLPLLQVGRLSEVALLLSRMGTGHAAAALCALARYEGGPKAVAAVLAELPPLAACKFVCDMYDQSKPLMPIDVRKAVLAAMAPELVLTLEGAAKQANEAALQRLRAVRVHLQCFAHTHYVTSTQLSRVLTALRYEPDRVTAMVVLWARTIDRGALRLAYHDLTGSEQPQVMARLGYWHVWNTIVDPHGLHFALNLSEPEQKDIARDIVKMAVKETARMKEEVKSKGGGSQALHCLLKLHGNGAPVHIPEDDKMWIMIESNFKQLEFDYLPTPEQDLAETTWAARRMQQYWHTYQARRQCQMAVDAVKAQLSSQEGAEQAIAALDLKDLVGLDDLQMNPEPSAILLNIADGDLDSESSFAVPDAGASATWGRASADRGQVKTLRPSSSRIGRSSRL